MDSGIKIRALIVEDNPTQANMLRISLTRRGFDVEAVAYMAHGVDRLKKGGIDVVLLDLSLPDCDGIQTFYEIYNSAPDVPIVVLSGMNDHEVAHAALKGGAQDYLVKGVPSDESISRCLRYAIERHRFERQLWESERTTRLIVENAQDAFVSIDAHGKITGWNLKAENIFGWCRKEAMGHLLLDLIVPVEARPVFADEIVAFLNGHRGDLINNRVETTLLRKDGSKFPAELAMFPVTIGSDYTLCGFVQDISDRRLVDQRMKQINAELEKLVHERTTQLDDTSRQLNLFAKQASRELQEPIVAMQGMALALGKELRNLHNPRADAQIDRLLQCANQLIAAVQALGENGRNPVVDITKKEIPRYVEEKTVPPIAQVKLPEQMVPTSNILPPHLSMLGKSTHKLPVIERPIENPRVTRSMPVVDNPVVNIQKKQVQ